MARRADWRDEALCALPEHQHLDWFDERPSLPATRAAAEKAICARCPARQACLDDALAYGYQQFGIRGGLTAGQRDALRKRRRAAQL